MESTTICNVNEWSVFRPEDQCLDEHMVSDLPGEELAMLDKAEDGIYGDMAPMLDHLGGNFEPNFGSALQDLIHPLFQYPQPEGHGQDVTYRQSGHDDAQSPLMVQDDFDTSLLDFIPFGQYKDETVGKRGDHREESPDTSCKHESCSPPASPRATQAPPRKRPLRRQNHACDTCRSSKKACDLPLDVLIGREYKVSRECTTCKIRGVECTAEWLSKKQSSKAAKQRAKISEQSFLDPWNSKDQKKSAIAIQAICGIPTPTSTAEAELSSRAVAQLTVSNNFRIYIQSFDMPVTQCLLGGTMPPGYSLGIGAYVPLCNSPHAAVHIRRASSWVEACWPVPIPNHLDPTCLESTPHLFSAVSVLDALFFSTKGIARPGPSRDDLITDAYKWVAVATAAQFVLTKMEHLDGKSRRDIGEANMAGLQDVAYAAWRKARDKLFRNISATKSFRLATSLLLFGLLVPPMNSLEDGRLCEEDSRYALREGLIRLRSLNAHARCRLEAMDESQITSGTSSIDSLHNLSLSDRVNVVELIGAVDWMASMLNSVVIGTSKGTNCPMPFDSNDAIEGSVQEPEIDEIIVARMKHKPQPAVAYQELGDVDAMIRVGREASCISILLWRCLAQFTMAAEQLDHESTLRWYKKTMTLIHLWRTSFGSLDANTRLSFQTPLHRRVFAFYSNDADVAILLFHEAAQKLQARLSVRASSPAQERLIDAIQAASTNHKQQRLASAIMVSVIAASYNEACSAEAGVMDFDNIALHPLPLMMVQAHTLAAQAFADELHNMFTCSIDTRRARRMTDGLETCLNGLNGLRQTLVAFPEEGFKVARALTY